MDALSDVLRVAHLTGGVFLHAISSRHGVWPLASGLNIARLLSGQHRT